MITKKVVYPVLSLTAIAFLALGIILTQMYLEAKDMGERFIHELGKKIDKLADKTNFGGVWVPIVAALSFLVALISVSAMYLMNLRNNRVKVEVRVHEMPVETEGEIVETDDEISEYEKSEAFVDFLEVNKDHLITPDLITPDLITPEETTLWSRRGNQPITEQPLFFETTFDGEKELFQIVRVKGKLKFKSIALSTLNNRAIALSTLNDRAGTDLNELKDIKELKRMPIDEVRFLHAVKVLNIRTADNDPEYLVFPDKNRDPNNKRIYYVNTSTNSYYVAQSIVHGLTIVTDVDQYVFRNSDSEEYVGFGKEFLIEGYKKNYYHNKQRRKVDTMNDSLEEFFEPAARRDSSATSHHTPVLVDNMPLNDAHPVTHILPSEAATIGMPLNDDCPVMLLPTTSIVRHKPEVRHKPKGPSKRRQLHCIDSDLEESISSVEKSPSSRMTDETTAALDSDSIIGSLFD